MSVIEEDTGPLKGVFAPLWMPTFDKYFSWSFVKVCLFCLAVVLGLVVLVDNLENMDEFYKYAQKNNIGFLSMVWILFKHYAAYAPALVCQYMITVLPVAAGVVVVTQASVNREFTALRSSGISMQRAVLPFLILSLLMGGVYMLTRDLYVPILLRKSFEMNNKLRPMDIQPVKIALSDGDDRHFIEMGHYEGNNGVAHNLNVEVRKSSEFAAQGNRFVAYQCPLVYLQPYTNADNPADDHLYKWVPQKEGRIVVVKDNSLPSQPWESALPTKVRPAMLEKQIPGLGVMVMDWGDLLTVSESGDIDNALEIQRRLSEPLVPFAMLMVVLPLVLHFSSSGRQPSYIGNAILAIIGCGVFYALRAAFFSWGESEWIWPVVAGQGPIVIFVTSGVMLMRRMGN